MNILIIDDKDWGPRHFRDTAQKLNLSSISVSHYYSIKEFREAPPLFYDWALLDFFLDADRATGEKALPYIQSEYLICFASLKMTSDVLAEKALKTKRWDAMKIFTIKKIKNSRRNRDLELFIKEQMESTDIHSRLAPVLKKLKGDREAKIEALEIFGNWRDHMNSPPRPAFLEYIIPVLQKDPSDLVRHTAVLALLKMGYNGAIPFLEESKSCDGLEEFTLGENREASIKILRSAISDTEKKISCVDWKPFD